MRKLDVYKALMAIILSVCMVFLIMPGKIESMSRANEIAASVNVDKTATPTDSGGEDCELTIKVSGVEKAQDEVELTGIRYVVYKDEKCEQMIDDFVLSHDGRSYLDETGRQVICKSDETVGADYTEKCIELAAGDYYIKQMKMLRNADMTDSDRTVRDAGLVWTGDAERLAVHDDTVIELFIVDTGVPGKAEIRYSFDGFSKLVDAAGKATDTDTGKAVTISEEDDKEDVDEEHDKALSEFREKLYVISERPVVLAPIKTDSLSADYTVYHNNVSYFDGSTYGIEYRVTGGSGIFTNDEAKAFCSDHHKFGAGMAGAGYNFYREGDERYLKALYYSYVGPNNEWGTYDWSVYSNGQKIIILACVLNYYRNNVWGSASSTMGQPFSYSTLEGAKSYAAWLESVPIPSESAAKFGFSKTSASASVDMTQKIQKSEPVQMTGAGAYLSSISGGGTLYCSTDGGRTYKAANENDFISSGTWMYVQSGLSQNDKTTVNFRGKKYASAYSGTPVNSSYQRMVALGKTLSKTASFAVSWSRPTFKLVKTDRVTKGPVKGAKYSVFVIKNNKEVKVASVVTGSDGNGKFSSINSTYAGKRTDYEIYVNAGQWYYIREDYAPSDYVKNEQTSMSVGGKTVYYEARFAITAKDGATGSSISGNGTSFTYSAKTVRYNGCDVGSTRFAVSKTDSTSAAAVSGACYLVYRINGNNIVEVAKFKTDASGKGKLYWINSSEAKKTNDYVITVKENIYYYIKEIYCPAGYLTNPVKTDKTSGGTSYSYEACIYADAKKNSLRKWTQISTASFKTTSTGITYVSTDRPLPTFTLKKADASTGKAVSGAEYELYFVSNKTKVVVATYKTNASGVGVVQKINKNYATISNTAETEIKFTENGRRYFVHETKAATGYKTNQGNTVSGTSYKYEAYFKYGTDSKVSETKNVVSGTAFTKSRNNVSLTYTSKDAVYPTFTLKKVDSSTGKAVSGAEYELYFVSNNTKVVVATYKTNASGVGVVQNINKNYASTINTAKTKIRFTENSRRYFVHETKAPVTHQGNKPRTVSGTSYKYEAYFKFGTDSKVSETKTIIAGASFSKSDNNTSLTYTSKDKSRVRLAVNKTDSVTGKAVSGACYLAYRINGNSIVEVAKFKTDESGKGKLYWINYSESAKINDYVITVRENTYYYIKEIYCPAGYVTNPVKTDKTSGGTSYSYEACIYTAENTDELRTWTRISTADFKKTTTGVTYVSTDSPRPEFTLKKVDSSTGKAVSGAEYELYFVSNNTKVVVATYKTNASGVGVVQNINEKYASTANDAKTKIKFTGNNIRYYVRETKSPATHKLNAGTGTTYKWEAYFKFNASSVVSETKVADSSASITKGSNNTSVTYMSKDAPLPTFTLKKVDSSTGKAVSGAEYELYFVSNNTKVVVATYKTNASGVGVVQNINKNYASTANDAKTKIKFTGNNIRYYVRETKAATGYIVNQGSTVSGTSYKYEAYFKFGIDSKASETKTVVSGTSFAKSDNNTSLTYTSSDTPKTGSLRVVKYEADADGTLTKKKVKATFTMYDSSKTTVAVFSTSNSSCSCGYTDAKVVKKVSTGKYKNLALDSHKDGYKCYHSLINIPQGTYYLVETTKPTGSGGTYSAGEFSAPTTGSFKSKYVLKLIVGSDGQTITYKTPKPVTKDGKTLAEWESKSYRETTFDSSGCYLESNGAAQLYTAYNVFTPDKDPADIVIAKVDADTGMAYQGNNYTSLEGAVFEVKYYKGSKTVSGAPTGTWYFATDEDGKLEMSTNYLYSDSSHKNSSLPETNKTTGEFMLESGPLVITEIIPPSGYLNIDSTNKGCIGIENTSTKIEDSNSITVYLDTASDGTHIYVGNQAIGNEITYNDAPKRGDIVFSKKKLNADGTVSPMEGVVFKITNTETGEYHYAVTGKNGQFSSAQTRANGKKWLNKNCELYEGDENEYVKDETDSSYGVWFTAEGMECSEITEDMMSEDSGSFTCGKYIIEEVRCKANEGYILSESVTFEITEDKQVVDLTADDTFINVPYPGLTTKSDKNIKKGDKVSLHDTVTMTNLKADTVYTLKGIVMDKADGKAALDGSGRLITSTKTFTTGKADAYGCVLSTEETVEFAGIDSSDMKSTYVVFEYLYEGRSDTAITVEDGVPVTDGAVTDDKGSVIGHADIENRDGSQTFRVITIETKAFETETKEQHIQASHNLSISDIVTYEGLTGGEEYTLKAELVFVSETDESSTVSSATKTFTAAEGGSGEETVAFDAFDATPYEGHKLVVFERLYDDDGNLMASEENVNEESQTIYFITVKTNSNGNFSPEEYLKRYDSDVTLTDKVSCTNLEVGRTYTVSGTLMTEDGEEVKNSKGELIQAYTTFEASEADMTVDVVFTYNPADCGLVSATVVFEDLSVDEKNVASHADLKDEPQKNYYPEIKTELVSGSERYIKEEEINNVSLTDKVTYSNIPEGVTFTVVGKLVNAATGEVLTKDGKEISASGVFTSESISGTVSIDFPEFSLADAGIAVKNNEGEYTFADIVAYEYLYAGETVSDDTLRASENDINSEDQTIRIMSVHTEAADGRTNSSQVALSAESVLVDSVRYTGLVTGKKYTVSGTLMCRETNSPVTTSGGEKITASTTFTAEKPDGYINIVFTYDAVDCNLAGKTVVAFEDLIPENGSVYSHADINDENQTVYVPKAETVLTSDGAKEVTACSSISLTDTIKLTNLVPENNYKLSVSLYNVNTGAKIKAGDKYLTKEYEFTAQSSSFEYEAVFDGIDPVAAELITDDVKTADVTAVTSLFYVGKDDSVEVIRHNEDLSDKDETVTVRKPVIHTVLSRIEVVDGLDDYSNVTVEDDIHAEGLVKGQKYRIITTLYNKSTKEPLHENGRELTALFDFTAAGDSVSYTAPFNGFDAVKTGLIKNDRSVSNVTAVTELYLVTDNTQVLAAEHNKDCTDANETIDITERKPRVKTVLSSAEGDKVIQKTENISLTDEIAVSGMIEGRDYKTVTTLYNTDTKEAVKMNGKELVAVKEFNAKSSNTEFGITFASFNVEEAGLLTKSKKASGVSDVTAVTKLYEKQDSGYVLIFTHNESLTDSDETISITSPEISTSLYLNGSDAKAFTAGTDEVRLTDTVSYNGLVKGEKYTLKAYLYNRSTGKAITKDSASYLETKTFTAEDAEGSVDVDLTFVPSDAGIMEADGTCADVVCFEYLYYGEEEIASHADLSYSEQTVSPVLEGHTKARDKASGSQSVMASEKAVITDHVSYTNLIVGKKYNLTGTLMDKETGKPLDADGAVKTVTFTAEKKTGVYDMEFEIDASKLAGKSAVVFERMTTDNREVFVHEDINDEEQTVSFPEIGTTATVGNAKKLEAGKTNTITDTISYTNLCSAEKYKIVAKLVDKKANKVVSTAEKEFTTGGSDRFVSGSTTMEVTFDVPEKKVESEETDEYVVYEYIYTSNNTLIAEHEDINDSDQTVSVTYMPDTSEVPEISTSLHLNGNDAKAFTAGTDEVRLTDTVSYNGLVKGEKYTLKAYLYNRSTGKAITKDGASYLETKTFTAEDAEGSVDVDLTFVPSDAGIMEADGTCADVVCFEYLYYGEEEIASHADLSYSEQTVSPVPEGHTKARDKASGSQSVMASEKAVITDHVSYTNLIVGKKYKLTGTLMDKETGKPLDADGAVKTVTFTAEKKTGVYDMEFEIDASKLAGKSAVVFERMTTDDREVFVHEDINDEEQTVSFPEIGTTATVGKTKKLEAGKTNTITDTISYTNLCSTEKYKIVAKLVDKKANKVVSTAEKEFTTGGSDRFVSGSTTMEVTFDVPEKKVESEETDEYVVYEYIYTSNNTLIVKHEDINYMGQTVSVTYTPDKETTPPDTPKTGDTTKTGLLIGMFAAALCGCALIIRAKRNKV